MHKATMQQCRKLLKQINVPVTVGRLKDNMEPDMGDSHGWDFHKKDSGSLLDKVEQQYETIRQLVDKCNGSIEKVDKESFSKAVRYLCHYTEDAHSIGQLSSEFWGKIDNRIDIRSELVRKKKKYSVKLLQFDSKEKLRESLYASMRSVYDTYRKRAKSPWFLVSRRVGKMARNAVKLGAEYAAAYVYLAVRGG